MGRAAQLAGGTLQKVSSCQWPLQPFQGMGVKLEVLKYLAECENRCDTWIPVVQRL